MAQPLYDFRPMTNEDLPLMRCWLMAPHVARWWGEPDEAIEEIRQAISEASTHPFIILIDGRPSGYIQSYDIHAESDHPYRDQPRGTVGIDLSLGEEHLLGRGHGPRIITAFVNRLFIQGAPRVVIDPAPDNNRAIRAYQKAGFCPLGQRTTPEYGPALIMARDALQQAKIA
jgi:aminoglycoside 6'-N-acetyltransferase